MSAEPTRLTDDDRRKLTHIPNSVETREGDVLENLLFDLFIRGILTDDTFVKSFGIDRKEVHTIKGS